MAGSRFQVTWAQAMRDLSETFSKWLVEDWDVERPYSGRREHGLTPEQRMVIVWWKRGLSGTYAERDTRIELGCSEWDTPRENLRAIWYAVESLRMNEQRGVGELAQQAYAQLAAPQADTGYRNLNLAALELQPGATDEEIEQAWRRMAREHHPDAGGDEEVFKQLNAAYRALKA